ncbi:acyl-CoA dehydrogenase family protein [Streptomyces sp. NPDC051567]|uniref:acyl-CoA dehydrogenase family protein n=1 Tax=Streptomyces sp. NPDC051567 TaxID=3365660 RepID=UPI0037A6FC54
MLTTDVPTREQLVHRAAELRPLLRKHAAWAEENRRIHDESIEALADAGIFRMRLPARHGGFESDARTMVEVASELGRADGSTAWTASVYWIPGWMAGLFPDPVQDEVFATPGVRICGTLSPGGMAAPVDGGVVVNGQWKFISGALHAHWQVVVAIQPTPGGAMPVMALVPMADLTVVDDWHTAGLKGTGSVTTVAQNVFVPAERVLPLPVVVQGQGGASQAAAGSPLHRPPLLPVASASSVGAVLGLARAAGEAFFERLPDRKITYTDYASQREAPLTHLQVAEATLKTDQAEFHALRLADLVDSKAAGEAPWTLQERVRARADLGAVCRLAKEAVDIFQTASGGSSIYLDVPIQRISRDVQAVNLHALMHPDTNTELYGRVLCGLEPNTLYI